MPTHLLIDTALAKSNDEEEPSVVSSTNIYRTIAISTGIGILVVILYLIIEHFAN